MASALTPAGTLSSSKTTLCGNALLFTNSTVSPLATVMEFGCYFIRVTSHATPHVSHRVIACVPHVRIHVAPSRARTSHIMVRDYTIIRPRAACHKNHNPTRRVIITCPNASPRETYEEPELAVVATELDGGRERRGGQREGGRRDDGSLCKGERRIYRAYVCVSVFLLCAWCAWCARSRSRSRRGIRVTRGISRVGVNSSPARDCSGVVRARRARARGV